MNVIEIINKKRLNQELTYSEIEFIIDGYLKDDIKDYQMSSFLMAITINGMSIKETSYLTDIMIKSGTILDFSDIKGIKIDKHSTGGVGDKTTLILMPLLASIGIPVIKMSGRGLGHTGGTIDKLEAIPGCVTNIALADIKKQVNDIGIAIASQTENLVPADKKIYALRDVTGTVESIPLIASSIMSKKIASGADKIIIDVKVGTGALIKNIEDAKLLANYMLGIAKEHNRELICVLTNMNEPLGLTIGNMLEVEESISLLKGSGPEDLKELVITLAVLMTSIAKDISTEKAHEEVINSLNTGKAYNKFKELIYAQKGKLDLINDSKKFSIKSIKSGYIQKIDAYKLGELARSIGAGRYNKEDEIDYQVGFVLNKKVGDYVDINEELMKAYLTTKDCRLDDLINCFLIDEHIKEKEPLIYEVIR